jgi:DNA-binding transcriptional ArsR family regulator
MTALSEQLRQYAVAISDPTRGSIVVELDRAGELTATHLARRLGLTANNVYHHMRVLRGLGVVDPPRAVPGDTYVEKYYRINPELQAAVRLDQDWYERVGPTLAPEDRQALVISVCLTMAELLRRAARNVREMETGTFMRQVTEEQMLTLSMNRISRGQMQARMQAVRAVLEQQDREWAEDTAPRTELMLLAGLPGMFIEDQQEG